MTARSGPSGRSLPEIWRAACSGALAARRLRPSATADQIRELAHAKGKIGRAIPRHQDAKIVIDQIAGSLPVVGAQQRRGHRNAGEIGAIIQADAQSLPFRQWLPLLEAGE